MTDPKLEVTDSPNDAVKETTAVPVDIDEKTDAADEPSDEVTDEPSDDVTDEPSDEVTDEPSDETSDEATEEAVEPAAKDRRRVNWSRVFALGVLPALVLLLAAAAGFLKWQDNSVRADDIARIEAMQAAREGTVALLSYQPATVEQQLGAARDLLTGEFRDSYTSLTNDVVIPGAKEKQISAVATVPAAASVSTDPDHAVVLLFVNQTVVVGTDPPTDTASSVRVTLDKIDGRWLISEFEPV